MLMGENGLSNQEPILGERVKQETKENKQNYVTIYCECICTEFRK